MREEVEPLDHLWGQETFTPRDEAKRKILEPLKTEVRRRGLRAAHLGPDLAGRATASSSRRC
ncbi:hypothetical protein [Actinomadura nitritigenes]|uniref:hypothetical protein n=1 Tax=Actinomadura nitritigenes TaxID=134602 RepID=UPI003D8D460D